MEIRTLVADTETNGKRMKGRNPPLSSEPSLTQLAAVLYLGRRPVGHMSCFVWPVNFAGFAASIPTEEFFIKSGITQETVDAVGLQMRTGIAMFNQFVKLADRIVYHNVEFDDPIVRSNYARCAAPQRDYWDTPKFCTMQTLTDVLKIPGKFGNKYPSLDESYRALVDPNGFSGAHDAMVDVDAAAKVLFSIEDRISDPALDPRFQDVRLWQLQENWPTEN